MSKKKPDLELAAIRQELGKWGCLGAALDETLDGLAKAVKTAALRARNQMVRYGHTPHIPASRWDALGEWRLMASVDGYVMVRRPGCIPQVKHLAEWLEMDGPPVVLSENP